MSGLTRAEVERTLANCAACRAGGDFYKCSRCQFGRALLAAWDALKEIEKEALWLNTGTWNEAGARSVRQILLRVRSALPPSSPSRSCDACGARGDWPVEHDPIPDPHTGYVSTRTLCDTCAQDLPRP